MCRVEREERFDPRVDFAAVAVLVVLAFPDELRLPVRERVRIVWSKLTILH